MAPAFLSNCHITLKAPRRGSELQNLFFYEANIFNQNLHPRKVQNLYVCKNAINFPKIVTVWSIVCHLSSNDKDDDAIPAFQSVA